MTTALYCLGASVSIQRPFISAENCSKLWRKRKQKKPWGDRNNTRWQVLHCQVEENFGRKT